MQNLDIIWGSNISNEHKTEINKFLSPYLYLVPKWCQKIFIALHDDSDARIKTSISYEYRNATMIFYSSWLVDKDEIKTINVIHDLLHISTSVYVDFAENKIDLLCPESESPKFHQSLKEESVEKCESMVQDLAFSILQGQKLQKQDNDLVNKANYLDWLRKRILALESLTHSPNDVSELINNVKTLIRTDLEAYLTSIFEPVENDER